jgi:hypothetical protein
MQCVRLWHFWYTERAMSTAEFLDRYFEPVTAALSPQAAQAMLSLKPDGAAVARVAELGRKANDGLLTEDEKDEYRAYIDAGDLISILKAKARGALAKQVAS